MGRFLAIVVLLSACGDNMVVDPSHGTPGDDTTGAANAPSSPRYVPEVCGIQTYPTSIAGDLASQLAVVATPGGATIVAVPTAGGALSGFVVDDQLKAPDTGTVVPINDMFTQVSAALVDTRIVVAAVDATSVQVELLDADLSNPQLVGTLAPGFIAQPAIFKIDGATVLPVAGATGLTVYGLDSDFAPTPSTASPPATGLTMAQIGSAVIGAWSTTDDCYVARLSGASSTGPSQLGSACNQPQIAANAVDGTATLVYKDDGDVRMIHMFASDPDAALAGGATSLVQPNARSPRVIFDGTYYWVSYIDIRGDIVMGFVDGNLNLVSMALDGVQPQDDAYQLVMIGASPWVLSLDAGGYTGHRMCITSSDNW